MISGLQNKPTFMFCFCLVMRQLGPFQPFKISRILVGGRDVEVSFTSRFAKNFEKLKKFMSGSPGHRFSCQAINF